jgi:hypothetical protein
MKFHGNGMVWDAERSKSLCEFTNGECETGDARVIEILKRLGYAHEESAPISVMIDDVRIMASVGETPADVEPAILAEMVAASKDGLKEYVPATPKAPRKPHKEARDGA